MRTLPHPKTDDLDLANVLEALSDPTRLAIVAFLASLDGDSFEARCGDLTAFGSKSNLAYHLAKMRESGVTLTRVAGTSRYISLRREDLETRFPGLLATIVTAALSEPDRAAMVARAQEEAREMGMGGEH